MTFNRVLLAEDEMVIAMLVEDMVVELGYEVVGIISKMDDALRVMACLTFDVAILDVHLNGKLVFPLADALAARHIPYIFATGYGRRGIPVAYSRRPILQKPFRITELDQILKGVSKCGQGFSEKTQDM